jgi:hypothetical protein
MVNARIYEVTLAPLIMGSKNNYGVLIITALERLVGP